jgi:BirA family transcriptional regulator, biotin operon repressor / biotin---[acetyl-CoA-carboxylase] ligase
MRSQVQNRVDDGSGAMPALTRRVGIDCRPPKKWRWLSVGLTILRVGRRHPTVACGFAASRDFRGGSHSIMAAYTEHVPRDWPFVNTFVKFEVLDSTSDRAAELVRGGSAELPLAVWAQRQTRGRGRGSNQWWSDAGSLTFTLAINPAKHKLTVENEPKLALAMAVAVIDALGELALGCSSIGIRWPNDLEVNGRKIGGILPERIETSGGHRILIGVGVNVLTSLANAPDEIRRMATSLAELNAKSIDEESLPRLLSAILKHFESVLIRLVNGDTSLPAYWNDLDRLRDQWIRVELGTRIVAGLGRGIDAEGALCVDDGRQQHRLIGGQVLRTR